MRCPFKFSHYEFEGGQDCIGDDCGMHKLCANDTLAAENDVSEGRVDANDVNADTREKLEADAIQLAQNIWHQGMNYANGVREIRHIAWQERDIIDLLDRQAAITERECIGDAGRASMMGVVAHERECYDKQIAELQAKLDQMTVERDILQDCVDDLNADTSELQAKLAEYESKSEICTILSGGKIYTGSKALTERIAELQAKVDELTEDYKASSNGLEILTFKNAELQTQVNNLNSENAKLSSDELHLRNALAQSEHELATLRDKLGRMLDCSHEITRIGGDC